MRGLDRFPNYVYQKGQEPAFLYHTGLGINAGHEDFRSRLIEWLYTDCTIFKGQNIPEEVNLDTSPAGHDTCTASKAIGNVFGAAKSGTAVVVKLPDISEMSINGLLPSIVHDIRQRNRQGRSVVLFPFSLHDLSPRRSPLFRHFLNDLMELESMNVMFVCGAGNKDHRSEPIPDTAPTIFSTQVALLPVSSCDSAGI